jgi:hypothetical protein
MADTYSVVLFFRGKPVNWCKHRHVFEDRANHCAAQLSPYETRHEEWRVEKNGHLLVAGAGGSE